MSSPIDPSTNTPPPGGSLPRVLVVDDEQVVRTVARLMLERTGYAVEEVSTAADALTQVQSAEPPFVVILIDFTLPDRTGTDVLPELRRAAPGSRIVLTSGRPEADFPNHGADGYLPKPFTKDQLAAVIQKVTVATGG